MIHCGISITFSWLIHGCIIFSYGLFGSWENAGKEKASQYWISELQPNSHMTIWREAFDLENLKTRLDWWKLRAFIVFYLGFGSTNPSTWMRSLKKMRTEFPGNWCIFVILESYVMMIGIDLIETSVGSLKGKETNSISSRLGKELLPWFVVIWIQDVYLKPQLGRMMSNN